MEGLLHGLAPRVHSDGRACDAQGTLSPFSRSLVEADAETPEPQTIAYSKSVV